MSVKIIVIVCLVIAISFFTWYFITSREQFASDDIHYYNSLHHEKEIEKSNPNEEDQPENEENESDENESEETVKKTPLNLDDFEEDDKPRQTEIDSILKSPEEQQTFIPSEHFTGQKDGYVFKNGRHGNGYYLERHVQFNL